MPNWSGGILTTRGLALQAKVDAGQTNLVFTKMKIGSGILGSGQNLESLTDLIAPKQNIGISGIVANNNITTLTGVVTNAGLAAGYQVRELGVFAQDPALGEILYSVSVDSSPDYLPEEGGSVAVSEEFNYHIAVSNAANVSAVLSTSGLVTVGMLQQHTHDGTGSNGPRLGSSALQDGAATDFVIGNRTITDTTAAAAGAGTLTNLLSKLGYMIKSITGKSNWYTLPALTLEAINTLFGTTGHAHTGVAGQGPKISAANVTSTATGDVAATNVQAAIAELAAEKAPLASPALTGTPSAPTATAGTSTTQLATTAFVATAITNLIASSPAALDTLNELAEALGNDPNFATTMTNALAGKQPLDATLTALAALTTAANQITYATGNDTFATTALTAFGRTLLDDADAVTARATLGAAPLASPALTGTPTAPTAATGTNTTQLATTAFVATAIANLIASSPAALDTLNELATALGNDPNFATTMTNALALKAPLASPALTGTPTASTAAAGTNTTQLATTAFANYAANGVLTKSVAGSSNVTLTAAEAAAATLVFTGALTANISVIVPAAAGQWNVKNATTGAYTLTVKTAAGTGVIINQGFAWALYCDGTNVVDAVTDFKDIPLTGTPTAPTAAAGTNTTQIATTAFVQAIGSGIVAYSFGSNGYIKFGNGLIIQWGRTGGATSVTFPIAFPTDCMICIATLLGPYTDYSFSVLSYSTTTLSISRAVVSYQYVAIGH